MASRAVMPRSPAPCVDLGTDSVVTNAQVQEAPAAPPAVCVCRWKIAPWPRAGTQGTGVQHCQGRTARIQCHPLGSAAIPANSLASSSFDVNGTIGSGLILHF